MKNKFLTLTLLLVSVSLANCKDSAGKEPGGGMASIEDKDSMKNVVQIAVGSKDHTTLVTAVKAADLVDTLANPGPFTVFAPTNAAFDKLPKGTVDELLKSSKIKDLQNILEYHVAVGVYNANSFTDGQVINQSNSDNITIQVKGGKVTVNGANILASVPAANGVVHVIDAVLLPPAKK